MGKPILPEVLREEIEELLRKGYTRKAVSKFVEDVKGSNLLLTLAVNNCKNQLCLGR